MQKKAKKRDSSKFINFWFLILALILFFLFLNFQIKEEVPISNESKETSNETKPFHLQTKEIFIHANYFEPPNIVEEGDLKVKWVNSDEKSHTLVCIEAENNQPLFEVVLYSNESFEWIFPPGIYWCWEPDVGMGKMSEVIMVKK